MVYHPLPDILTIEDLVEIDPNRGEFLIKLQDLVNQKQNMVNESEWDELTLNMGGSSQDQDSEGTLNNVKVEDLDSLAVVLLMEVIVDVVLEPLLF